MNPLSKLTSLQQLDVSQTEITDLNPLSKLTRLQRLDISNTKISKLNPLIGEGGAGKISLASSPDEACVIRDIEAMPPDFVTVYPGYSIYELLDLTKTHPWLN